MPVAWSRAPNRPEPEFRRLSRLFSNGDFGELGGLIWVLRKEAMGVLAPKKETIYSSDLYSLAGLYRQV
jgi:hypothetical protein